MKLGVFLRRPILAAVISIIITLCGMVALFNLPVSQFPDISPPSIHISASFPGANAETSARVVATQIENQLNGVTGLTYMSSTSNAVGNISINLTFDVGTDLNFAINEILNRIYAAIPLLPPVVQKIGVVARKSSPDMLLLASFYSDPYIDTKFVSNYLQRTVQNDLLLLPSVGSISVFGTGQYAIRIWLNPNKMQYYNVTVADIESAIKDQNIENFVGRTDAPPGSDKDSIVLNIKGNEMYSKPEQFANIILRANKQQIVKIKDVARVELGSNYYTTIGEVSFKDKKTGKIVHYPCNVMQIFLNPGANEIEAKKAVEARLKQDAKSFPYGLKYNIFIDNSRFVQASVNNVEETLLFAFLLVGLVIFVFLRNWRSSIIAILSIPISVIGTMACLYIFDFSLNTLSLFALVLAIGIVVDDSIVIVENVERLRHENPKLPLREVIALTLDEVFGAVIAIVLVLSVVFIPDMLLGGLAGIMFKQFAVTIACAVVLSGLCALTFTPAMTLLVMRKVKYKVKKTNQFEVIFEKFTNLYVHMAKWLIYHKKTAICIWLVIILITVQLFKLVPMGFVPNEDQGLIFASLNLPSSSSLNDTNNKVHQVIEELSKNPAINSIISVAGFDFLDSGNQKTYAASFFVSLKNWSERRGKGEDANSIIENINQIGAKNRDMTVKAFNQPVIRGLSTTGGIEFYVEDRVNGDPQALEREVNKLLARLKKHKEVAVAFQTLDTNVLQTSIQPDVAKAKEYGVNVKDLYNTIQTIYSNNNINYAYIMQDLVWVIMEAEYKYSTSVNDLRNVYVRSNSNDSLIPVTSLVKISDTRGAQVIQRFNGYISSKVTVFPNWGSSFGDVMNVVRQEADNLDKQYNYEWVGTSYQITQSKKTSTYAFVFSIIMIFLVLAALYEMWRLPLVVMMGIPFAMFGAALILLVSHQPNDLYFQISLIALLGLSAKNIILFVEFALQYFNEGHNTIDSAIFALRTRFRPIVMTSLTFVAGTLPLVFASGAGANAQHSVGYGIIGGILGSVFLSTLLTPAFFVLIMNKYKLKSEDDYIDS
ncbi:MAG: hypothetical protein RL017_850 [Pseudomonadota bacterium]|jgi:hydrophobe/amphiphile efflux-1 (HAE1) family protein|nr:efflux RND transporter permease subunit [Burkholderiales bacterium]